MSKRSGVPKTRSTPTMQAEQKNVAIEAREIWSRPEAPGLLQKAVDQGLLPRELADSFLELAGVQ